MSRIIISRAVKLVKYLKKRNIILLLGLLLVGCMPSSTNDLNTGEITAKEAYSQVLPIATNILANAYIARVRTGIDIPTMDARFYAIEKQLNPSFRFGVEVNKSQVTHGKAKDWAFIFCSSASPFNPKYLFLLAPYMVREVEKIKNTTYLQVGIGGGETLTNYLYGKDGYRFYPFDPATWQIDSPEAVKIAEEKANEEQKRKGHTYYLNLVDLYCPAITRETDSISLIWSINFVPRSSSQVEGLRVNIDATTGKIISTSYPTYQ